MPLPPLIHQYSRYIPVFTKKKYAIANGVAIATLYRIIAIATPFGLQLTSLVYVNRHNKTQCGSDEDGTLERRSKYNEHTRK